MIELFLFVIVNNISPLFHTELMSGIYFFFYTHENI